MGENKNIYTSVAIKCALFMAVVMSLSACVNTQQPKIPPEDTLQKQNVAPMRPNAANVSFSWMELPPHVDPLSFSPFKLSTTGQILIGNAVLKEGDAPLPPISEEAYNLDAFWWDLTNKEWLWLDGSEHIYDATLMGMNSTGEQIFGAQWVWQKAEPEVKILNLEFWAYVLTDQNHFIGAGLDSSIAMATLDGAVTQSWLAADVLKLDSRGNIKETLFWVEQGEIITSTMEECLQDLDCKQAYFTHWTPEQGSMQHPVEMPDRPEGFFQSNAGPELVSQNGQWLAGSVGQGIYLWSLQGEIKFLGGFDNGGTVVSLSNDGKMAVGYTSGNQSKLSRSWIWTETEGLGWLDEWLRDHGVAAENISKTMQVRLLSPDRRVMIGVTMPENTPDGEQAMPQWWKVDLSEHLRVLI